MSYLKSNCCNAYPTYKEDNYFCGMCGKECEVTLFHGKVIGKNNANYAIIEWHKKGYNGINIRTNDVTYRVYSIKDILKLVKENKISIDYAIRIMFEHYTIYPK